MRPWIIGIIVGAFAMTMASTGDAQKNPTVLLKTSMGDIKIELDAEKAPVSVENFLNYVKEGFYNGTIFHRVIEGFMIQGGGLTQGMDSKPTKPPIQNEAGNGLKNSRGTLAMARTSDVHSATGQFFINVADNAALDHQNTSPQGFGYAVFGRVTEGMEVVDRIKAVETTTKGHFQDVPAKEVVIESVEILQ